MPETLTQKAANTRRLIIDEALRIACEEGITAVTVRNVAARLGLSKSGVFNRVDSIEALQLEVLDEYARQFLDEVFFPSLKSPRGLPRLVVMMHRWIDRVAKSKTTADSLFEAVAFATDPVDPVLAAHVRSKAFDWIAATRACVQQAIDEGHLKPSVDAGETLFELHSILLGTLYATAFLKEARSADLGRKLFAKVIHQVITPKGKRATTRLLSVKPSAG